MYTQCPDCATVFRVTAELLRAAQGAVRCGVCATSFNALENLSEEPFRPSTPGEEPPAPEDTITVEEGPAVESIELSSANELAVLEEPPEEPPAAEAHEAPVAPAPDAQATAPSDEAASLEFHGDEAELDRLFVVDSPTRVDFDPAAVAASLSAGGEEAANDEAPQVVDLDATDEYPILVLDERDEPAGSPGAPDESGREAPSAYGPPRILIPDEMRRRLAEQAAALPGDSGVFDELDGADRIRRWPWIAALVLLSLALAAQMVHRERDALLRQPGIGPWVAGAYELIGSPIASPTDLGAFELRQWGAASDPARPGHLLLRASIVNRAPYAQPYPLLRLALQDRFGTTVGALDVEPATYLPGGAAGSLLASGARADAEIRIVDPGEQAVGFEMDVCLRDEAGIRCASQPPGTAT